MPFAESSAERRITLRLLAYWEKLRRGRTMPTEAEVTAHDIADLWQDCFILHFDSESRLRTDYIGPDLLSLLQHHMDRKSPVMLEGKAAQSWLADMQKTPRPILHEGEMTNAKGRLVRYRQCMLPLGDDDRLTAILGAMRCKVV